MTARALDRARDAAAHRAWRAAAEAYLAADREHPLPLEDLEAAGLAAHLSGDGDAAIDLWTRAYREAEAGGDLGRAAMRAFWLGMMLSQRGEVVLGGGWLARAGRLIEEGGLDGVERGFLQVPAGLGALEAHDPQRALASFERGADIAARFADPDLTALARLGRGRALIELGEIQRGISLLDEAMVGIAAGEVNPVIVGVVYCAAIEGFQAVFDLRRAQEWTDVLTRWCADQPDLVPFRGRCLVYRAELMRLHGQWDEASDEARRAEEWLSKPPPEPAVGEAMYQRAELARLQGSAEAAETWYRAASRWGRSPQPGLALLRLRQGRTAGAVTMIRRALADASTNVARAGLLDAAVEIDLAAGRIRTALEHARELAATADRTSSPLLAAEANRADGLVRLADGHPDSALARLRSAVAGWEELGMPYELARTRLGVAAALRALGEHDVAEIELDAARAILRDLGATPDLDRLDSLVTGPPDRGALSARELEVLRLLATGRTNRSIAEELGLSERTIDRHVSNIFDKLDVSSRAAATAFAYEHGLA